MKEQTLSIKGKLGIYFPMETIVYSQEDVKEFIKKLKEYCFKHNQSGTIVAIEQFAGEKLR